MLLACTSSPEPTSVESPTASSPSPSSESPAQTVTLEPWATRCAGSSERPAVRPFQVGSASGEELYGVMAGSGRLAVVLVHGSGSVGVCNWANEVPWLVRSGLRVVAYDAACVGLSTCAAEAADPLADLVAMVNHARERGVRSSVVVAASAGGPLAIDAAALGTASLDATVALSPAGLGASLDRYLEAASNATVPILIALARDDSAATPSEVRRIQAVAAAGATLELLPPGSGHAQQVLYSTTGGASPFRAQLLRFIIERAAPGG